jgi:prepilin-type N-terminal cleavage/methylation domain-containing protein
MNKKGITLVELIIVMAIIALGAVLMAPNIGAWIPHYRLNSASRDIASLMRLAQMRAVSTNTGYQVHFDADAEGTYCVIQRNTAGLPEEGGRQRLPAGITMDGAGTIALGGNVLFNPNSTASSGGLPNLTVVLGNTKGTKKSISVLRNTGKITLSGG